MHGESQGPRVAYAAQTKTRQHAYDGHGVCDSFWEDLRGRRGKGMEKACGADVRGHPGMCDQGLQRSSPPRLNAAP